MGAGVRDASGRLVAYTAVRLRFDRDTLAKFHNLRESLGLLVNLMLLYKFVQRADPAVRALLGGDEIRVWKNISSTTAIS